jgi:hypothetical protein
VDDDTRPIHKLQQLLKMHHLYFGPVDPDDLIPLADVATELQELLCTVGRYSGPTTGVFDEATRKALRELVGMENLEERWNGKGELIDRLVVDYLRDKYAR